jgi:hypothetical protein
MLTPPLLLADYAGYVDVSDRSELQFRTTRQLSSPLTAAIAPTTMGGATAAGTVTPALPAAALDNNGLDFFTTPQLRVSMTNRRLEFTFSYLPSLTVTDAELVGGAQVQILNAGSVGAAWHADRQVTVTVLEDGTYGRYNSANLTPVPGVNAATGTTMTGGTQAPPTATGTATAPPMTTMTGTGANPALQVKPVPQTITVLSTRTAANVSVQADRRTHVTMGAAYYATGGLGSSQINLPEQYGPSADASLIYDLSRHDASLTAARAYSSQFVAVPCLALTGYGSSADVCRPHDDVATITQGFRHDLERTTSLTAEAGVAFVRALNQDDQADRSVWLPSGRVSVAHRVAPMVEGAKAAAGVVQAANEAQASVQLAPLVNSLTGGVSNFVQATGLLTQRLGPALSLRGTVGGGQAIPAGSPSASTLAQGEVELDFIVGRQVNLAAGARAFWQRQAQLPTTTGASVVYIAPGTPVAFAEFFSAIVYFAVTVRAPELRF